jgi:ATPase subunit of ABC transporter with duplicated ATPase domains
MDSGSDSEGKAMVTRLIDYLKAGQVTSLFTSLTQGAHQLQSNETGMSSLMDAWMLLQDFEGNGERNRVLLARVLKSGANLLLLDEPTNDLDVNSIRALEEALETFAGCAVIISHDRWFLDRVATHIMAFEGDSYVHWFAGNYSSYLEDFKKRKGKEADQPHRIKYRKLSR